MKNAVGYKKFFIQAFIKLRLSRTMPPMFFGRTVATINAIDGYVVHPP